MGFSFSRDNVMKYSHKEKNDADNVRDVDD